jgi:hypothetical protein
MHAMPGDLNQQNAARRKSQIAGQQKTFAIEAVGGVSGNQKEKNIWQKLRKAHESQIQRP